MLRDVVRAAFRAIPREAWNPVTFRRIGPVSYDPATDVQVAGVPFEATGRALGRPGRGLQTESFANASRTRMNSRVLLVDAPSLQGWEPAADDTVAWEDATWTVVGVMPSALGASVWEVRVTR